MNAVNDIVSNESRLFSKENIKWYIGFSFLMLLTIAISFLSFLRMQGPNPGNQGPGQYPPGGGVPNPTQAVAQYNLWPLWGSLEFPTPDGILLGISLLAVSLFVLYELYRRNYQFSRFIPLVLFGIFLIILSNSIDGWSSGIELAISGLNEIYTDALNIVNPLDFISSYESIQPTLTVHAQTQPPGAVLTIYLFSVLFINPGFIAIGISVVSGLLSSFFARGIMRNWFNEEVSNYIAFLYLLLPAVQIYYLANIYAIVATLAFGSIYYYFHENTNASYVLIVIFIFLGMFVSFLFAWVPLFFFVYEILTVYFLDGEASLSSKLNDFVRRIRKLFIVCLIVGLAYLIMYFALDFNYVEAFL
ncbi:MAG: hypothetical protein P1Q69_18890, partial [Candidatus Thorarchaeota archaeon]|nr:hypothetical protein [Candidatus Thorarchaeota archaeon]